MIDWHPLIWFKHFNLRLSSNVLIIGVIRQPTNSFLQYGQSNYVNCIDFYFHTSMQALQNDVWQPCGVPQLTGYQTTWWHIIPTLWYTNISDARFRFDSALRVSFRCRFWLVRSRNQSQIINCIWTCWSTILCYVYVMLMLFHVRL